MAAYEVPSAEERAAAMRLVDELLARPRATTQAEALLLARALCCIHDGLHALCERVHVSARADLLERSGR